MASSSSLPPPPTANTATPHHNPLRGRRKPPPVSISTRRADVDPLQLRELLLSSGLSRRRFPRDGPRDPVDLRKLRLALAHSPFVVSAFCSSRFLSGEEPPPGLGGLLGRAMPVPVADRRLVGFGRAVSDLGLTASIHDVVVMPSLWRLGIGRKIVQKLIRLLTSKEIYDISALCSETERLFFQACGFGVDSLGSTTMMYTRSTSPYPEDRLTFQSAGQRLLLVPPPLTPGAYPSKKKSTKTDHLLDVQKLT